MKQGVGNELSAGSETGFSSVACTNLLLGLEIRVCADTLCVCMYRCVCLDINVCTNELWFEPPRCKSVKRECPFVRERMKTTDSKTRVNVLHKFYLPAVITEMKVLIHEQK